MATWQLVISSDRLLDVKELGRPITLTGSKRRCFWYGRHRVPTEAANESVNFDNVMWTPRGRVKGTEERQRTIPPMFVIRHRIALRPPCPCTGVRIPP